MEEKDGEFSVCWWVQEEGVVPIGMEAACDAGMGRLLDAQALGREGHAAVWADAGLGAHAPDVRPPRTARHRGGGMMNCWACVLFER